MQLFYDKLKFETLQMSIAHRSTYFVWKVFNGSLFLSKYSSNLLFPLFEDYQWRYQNFLWGASRGQNAFLRGQKFKICRKWLILTTFFLGEVGERASEWGKMPPMPPLMPSLKIILTFRGFTASVIVWRRRTQSKNRKKKIENIDLNLLSLKTGGPEFMNSG